MIYLHIGMNKTGSSSIQRILHENREGLSSSGILYPETGLGTPKEGYGYHYMLGKKLGYVGPQLNLAENLTNAQELRDSLDREIEETGPDNVIISSEFLCLRRNTAPIRRFLEGLDVCVIVYLRRHDVWYPSLYAQALKSVPRPPWNPGLDGYVAWARNSEAAYHKFGQLLDSWATVVGKQNVRVRAFEKESMRDNLIEDFFDLCNLPLPSALENKPIPFENKAPTAGVLAALEKVARASHKETVRYRIKRSLIQFNRTGSRLQMRSELKSELLEEHREDYARIAREYLGDPTGVLFRKSE